MARWRALRPLRLKGKREPVEAFELLGLLDAPGTRCGHGRRGAVRRARGGAGPGGQPARRGGRPGTSRACWCSPPRRASARPGSPPRWSGFAAGYESAPAGTRRSRRAGAAGALCGLRRAPPAGPAGRPGAAAIGLPVEPHRGDPGRGRGAAAPAGSASPSARAVPAPGAEASCC